MKTKIELSNSLSGLTHDCVYSDLVKQSIEQIKKIVPVVEIKKKTMPYIENQRDVLIQTKRKSRICKTKESNDFAKYEAKKISDLNIFKRDLFLENSCKEIEC